MNLETNKVKKKVLKLIRDLKKEKKNPSFPDKWQPLNVPNTHGVYVITKGKIICHVGKTDRGLNGLNQRLRNHLHGASSFVINYSPLNGNGNNLRNGYKYCYIEIGNHRERTLVEALATGTLCPTYVGTGE